MIIPLSTELRMGHQPWVTWIVIGLCIIVFGLQIESNLKYEVSVNGYCQLLASKKPRNINDLMSHDTGGCTYLLNSYHIQALRGVEPEDIEANILESLDELPDKQEDKLLRSLRKHYAIFSKYAPSVLNEKIMYFPESFNPLTMISSSLAHADIWHIAFNLIFFFAFSPAIELLTGNRWRYSASLLGIAVGCSLFYSLFALSEGTNVPGLGLSGVVMGVIGLSAYLMPHARINTLIWFIVPIARIPIPAWFMALWFIGFDAWDLLSEGMDQGVNLVAHVSGGALGYLIGRFFFKKRKEDVHEVLHEEINYQKSQRSGGFRVGSMASSYKNMRVLEEQHAEDQEKKQRMVYEDRLYNMIRTDQSSEAISLLLADTDPFTIRPDQFEDIFEQVGEWRKHRAYLCLGRLLIDLYMQHRRYADAFKVLKKCLEVSRSFVLANSRDVLLLAQEADRQKLYVLAFAILHNAEERYSEDVGYMPCGLLEVDILAHHIGKPELALKRLDQLKAVANEAELHNLNTLKVELELAT